jgi:hypothetical protein
MGDPAENRGLALLLASPASRFMTGGVYPVGGGALLQGRPCRRSIDRRSPRRPPVSGARSLFRTCPWCLSGYARSREGRGTSSAMTAPAARNAAPTGSAAVSPAVNDDGDA